MADQKLDKEAEDVLASIRRLVSHRPEMRAPARQAPAAEDKLVLTPALRVEEPDLPDDPGESVWSLEDRIAELEAAVGSTAEEWEPDGSEDADQETPRKFVFQHRPLRAEPEPEPEAVARPEAIPGIPGPAPEETPVPEPVAASEPASAPEAGPEPELPADEPGLDLTEALVDLDEDALRELVADLVRQELRGELGERITRNIRKLVRREIHRALMSRDFDE